MSDFCGCGNECQEIVTNSYKCCICVGVPVEEMCDWCLDMIDETEGLE